MSDLKIIIKTVNRKLDEVFSPQAKKIFLCLMGVALVMIVFLVVNLFIPQPKQAAVENEEVAMETPQKLVEVPSEEETILPVEDQMVFVEAEQDGRSNPFVPSDEGVYKTYNGMDVLTPPNELPKDTDATKVVKTKVSGIMFDYKSPSAILNIDDKDYLVRIGDNIDNYKVLNIAKDVVTVRLGSNIYKARVGEILADSSDSLNYNTIDHLNNKFGGARR